MVTFKRSHAHTVELSAPDPAVGHYRPSAGDSWTLTGKSRSVSYEITAPFSWVLVHTRLFMPSKSLFPQSCVGFGNREAWCVAIHGVAKNQT